MDENYNPSIGTNISVTVKETKNNRQIIEKIFNIFEEVKDDYIISKSPEPTWESNAKIFIGHGGKPDWEKLKNHLADKHDFDVVAYEIGARAGHEIRDVLEEMLDKATYAILVFTGENPDSEGKLHARENVIHELGLFQGRLGHKKTIVLLEEGVEKFSNIDGVQYIPYPKGHINSTFGDVLATIKREFKP